MRGAVRSALAALILALGAAVGAQGESKSLESELLQIQDAWAQAQYETPASEREARFGALVQRAEAFAAANP
jgi:hypothetical protein